MIVAGGDDGVLLMVARKSVLTVLLIVLFMFFIYFWIFAMFYVDMGHFLFYKSNAWRY